MPTVPDWLPGFVTVTVLAVPEPTVQVNVAEPDGPGRVGAGQRHRVLPAVLAVPEITPVEELIERPFGSPLAE